jgi:HlyD family secretion protein
MGERSRGITGAGGAFAGRGGSGRRQQTQTVWVLDDKTKKLQPAQIRTGITDGRYTEVVTGDLKEGDDVVVGLVTSKVEGPGPPGSQNPMAPRGPGGRGGR